MKAIRRMKEQQTREIEAMLDYEVKMQQIRDKNDASLRAQKQKEARHPQKSYRIIYHVCSRYLLSNV